MITKQWWSWWAVLWLYVHAQDPVAVLPQGRLLGIKVFPETSSTPVEIFYGIPYANPPVGRYRFSAPERHPGWRRTLFAHRPPPRCPDLNHADETAQTSEDCLYLNIWTPQRAEGSRLPVLVILFSESWAHAGPVLDARELAAAGLVVVSVSYRLHLLGWFTLRSAAARGNLALLDQYLAMLWVRENIATFGGDPAAVTLMGHSAGADCVLYHITSTRTAGLFKQAIVMSPLEVWRAISSDELSPSSSESSAAKTTELSSRAAAAALGCATMGDDYAVVRCMQSRTLTDILQLYNSSDWVGNFRPVADEFLPESAQYVPQPLALSLGTPLPQANRPLPILFGTTDLESVNENDAGFEDLANRGAENVMEYATLNLIPELLRLHGLHQSLGKYMLIEAVRWEYWGLASTSEGGWAMAERSRRTVSGAVWGAGGALLAARLARRARLHVYRYAQPGGVDLRGRELNYTGAAHGTDLVALLGESMLQQLSRRRATPMEQRLSARLRTYLANFVKYGSPEVDGEWKPYRVGAAYIHEIHEPMRAEKSADNRDAAFWLQHLPRLTNLTGPASLLEHTEKLTGREGETRLRGAVYALSGVSAALVALLCICAVLLQRAARVNRNMHDD